MTRDLLSFTTTTRDNALTQADSDAFLERRRVGRLGTCRGDGWCHLTPIWYLWEEGDFVLGLRNSRRHLATTHADDHVTLSIDVDKRPKGVCESPVPVPCFRLAELIGGAKHVYEITKRIALRYLVSVIPEFEEAMWLEGRTAVAITPTRWLAWDQRRA